jgi:transcriptional regulator with PAS, ATPase and Fis domain
MPAEAPFVEINCAALPEHLIESELFGYEKGAFTHATAERRGLFEEAAGGTIFLDEIGDLPLKLQAKLLSVLESKKFRRLGSNKPIEVKARIISATNRDLKKEVNRKMFREDLFYRLNVISITLPPLRVLKEDILIIATHLLKVFNIEFKKQVKGFSKNARQALLNYSWPGNVRELSNCLERTMIFIEKDWIEASDLVIYEQLSLRPEPTMQQWTLPNDGIVLEDLERHLIDSALQRTGNNKSKAARLLGLTRDTLRYRLEKYKLS